MDTKHHRMAVYLTDALKRSGTTVRSLAHDLNYRSPGSVSMWLSGATMPSLHQHQRLASLLGVDVRALTLGWIIETEPQLGVPMRALLDLAGLSFPGSPGSS